MNRRDTILIVDDMEVNRAILGGIFEREYNLLEAENGEQAMLFIEQYHDNIAVLLLDLVMPVKNGYQVMTELGDKSFLSEFPVVIITAEDSVESEVYAFDLGAADIIMKPFEPHVVKRRVQNIIDLNRQKQTQDELIEKQAAKLRQSNEVVIDALSSIIEYRSVETGQHIQRIRMFTKVLLEDVERCCPEFGLDEKTIDIIVSASSMHDIGKIAIPDSILNKPGRLTKEEFEIMKTHTVKGCKMLAELGRLSDKEYLRYAYNICRYHHERWDGRGYPDGLKGESIPVCAQVVGIADCYDALTTDRVYKKAISSEQAYNMILNGECGVFSPKLLESFKNVQLAFTRLARDYADGNMPKTDLIEPKDVVLPHQRDSLDTLQLGQMKYFTLLKYTDSTVMEVDFSTGLYHVVYLAGNDFNLLKSGKHFEESIRNFAQGAVYPEDRAVVLEILEGYLGEFFAEGLMRHSWNFRVYQKAVRKYCWCRETLLRIDTGYPHQRKAIIVWEILENAKKPTVAEDHETAEVLQNLIGVVQRVANDKDYTILDMDQRLLKLLGYTKQELQKRFQNKYLNLIYHGDREEVQRQIREQLRSGNLAELEYRVTAKGGSIIWILEKSQLVTDTGGNEYLYCALIDITQSKQAQEELRFMMERHKIIMEQTNDIIFEWDIERDRMVYSSNWEKKFGYIPILEQVSLKIAQVSHIHPEDLQTLQKLMEDMRHGIPYREVEFRIADKGGRYRWCKVCASAQFDQTAKPCKAVGVLTDIDASKREAQALQQKAERDELTNLYNKSTARGKIEEYLSQKPEGEMAAFMIIDVDDFKGINDHYGHMFGDHVLEEIACNLRRLFRSNDIIARIGGDEFLIFMYPVHDKHIIGDRAGKVMESVRMLFQESSVDFRFSCSIGIACCPADGRSFEVLFQHSDAALYDAKSKGKNCYRVYGQEGMENGFNLAAAQMTAGTRIESDIGKSALDNGLANQVFQRLYETENLEQAIQSILRVTGIQLGVSRVYIFEDSEDGSYCSNTFEWCNEGIEPQRDHLQNLIYGEMGGDYKKGFNEEGVFYCQDIIQLPLWKYQILELQNIKSTLQCAIHYEGKFWGFVGFDDCIVRRIWTQDQINDLMFVTKILGTFLIRKRAQERAVKNTNNLRNILDHQNAGIYVIDPDNYRLQYLNAGMKRLLPGARTGMKCYDLFFGRKEPCKTCPLRNCFEGEIKLYNDKRHICTTAYVSEVEWGDKKQYLFTSREMTAYKEIINVE